MKPKVLPSALVEMGPNAAALLTAKFHLVLAVNDPRPGTEFITKLLTQAEVTYLTGRMLTSREHGSHVRKDNRGGWHGASDTAPWFDRLGSNSNWAPHNDADSFWYAAPQKADGSPDVNSAPVNLASVLSAIELPKSELRGFAGFAWFGDMLVCGTVDRAAMAAKWPEHAAAQMECDMAARIAEASSAPAGGKPGSVVARRRAVV